MKKPFLSTAFSENGKNAKKRIENILTPSIKSAGILLIMCVIMLMCILNMAIRRDKKEQFYIKSAVVLSDSPLYMNPELSKTYFENLAKDDLVQVLFESGDNAYYVKKAVTEVSAQEGYISKEIISFDFERANQGILNSDTVYKDRNEKKPAGYKIKKGETVCVINAIDGEWARISLPGGIDNVWIPEKDIVYDLAFDYENHGGHYDEVKAYMQRHYTDVYSPYYDHTIVNRLSGYEETVDEETEVFTATFIMNTSHMNYYKDPDSVEYIKKAKESGNEEYYKTLYREYNQLKDGICELKLTADLKNGKIVEKSIILYNNTSPKGVEWVQLENGLKDFIIE